METVRTACPLDCWDACQVLASVDGERLVKIEGDPDHPITRGTLCSRTYRYPERAASPERILAPMRRHGGRFVEISWDEAMSELAARLGALRDAGQTERILHVQSSGSMGVLKHLSGRFWDLLGGVSAAEGDFCLGAGKAALTRHTGDYRAHDYDDVLNARLIVLWGRDPLVAGPHRMAFLKEARERGARVVSVNVMGIARAPIVAQTFTLRPGTDAWFAAGVARALIEEGHVREEDVARLSEGYEPFRALLFERELDEWAAPAGLAREDLVRFARMYGGTAPAAILLGTGPIRYRGGVEAAGWISALPALTGNYGRQGGGLSFSVRHMRGSRVDAWVPPSSSRPVPASTWHLEDVDPPFEVLWVNGANPVTMMPDSAAMEGALARIPFKVAVDLHWTDTARLADLVLPHPSFLEEEGLVTSWGHAYVAWQRAALPRRGLARTDLQIFQELAERLGFGDRMAGSPVEWSRRLMGDRLNSAEWNELLDGQGHVRSREHEPLPFTGGVFARENGRYLFPASPPDLASIPRGDDLYPFLLLTPKNREVHLSQALVDPERLAGRMGARVAAHIGVHDRSGSPARVRLRSRLGSVPALLEIDPDLAPDLVVVPFAGSRTRGTALNTLIEGACASDGVTVAYFDCPITVELG